MTAWWRWAAPPTTSSAALRSAQATSSPAIPGAATSNNLVLGNKIGADFGNSPSLANDFDGVYLGAGASANTIGGTTIAARNLISGNFRDGVRIEGAGTTGNLVKGNLIGLASDGATAQSNFEDGVHINAGAATNTIGGTALGAGNIISSNFANGVLLTDP